MTEEFDDEETEYVDTEGNPLAIVEDPFAAFRTDPDLERTGIYLDYGSHRVLIARAGGGNTKFARILEAKLKPYRRQMQTDTMDEKVADRITKEAFSDAVIRGWDVLSKDGKVNAEGEWTPGVPDPDNPGEILSDTKEAYMAVFNSPNLKDFFADVREQATRVGLFRQIELEEDAEN